MAFKWGSTSLYTTKDAYMEPWAEAPIVEIPLAPDPDNISDPSSVVQQQGRKREQLTFETYVKDGSIYRSLLADYYAGTVRTFTGPDGYSASMFIFNITQANRPIYPTRHQFIITLMEATP